MNPDIPTVTSIILDGGYYASIPTIGPSMYPAIRSGDKVYIESVNNKKLQKGNIILFKCTGNAVCHRLVRIFEKDGITYYQTRGDTFFHDDAPITYEQIIGRVIKVDRTEMSSTRRILLLLSPLLVRFSFLNAVIVNALVWLKTILSKSH